MAGVERRLQPELAAAIAGRTLPPAAWRPIPPPVDASFALDQSPNHWTLQAVHWLLWAYYARDAAQIAEACDAWLAFLGRRRGNWMEQEPLSRIYGSWHSMPAVVVLAIARLVGRADLVAEAEAWLRAWWAACTLCAGPGPRLQAGKRFDEPFVAMAGARSGLAHHRDRNGLDLPLALAIGWPGLVQRNPTWELVVLLGLEAVVAGRATPFDPGTRAGWASGVEALSSSPKLFGLALGEQTLLHEHVRRGAVPAEVASLLADTRPVVPFTFARGAGWVASVMHANPNGNTAAVYATLWHSDGRVDYMTLDSRDRKDYQRADGYRIVAGVATVEASLEGVRVHATGERWRAPGQTETVHAEFAAAGAPSYRVDWGPIGVRVAGQLQAPDPPAPPPPPPPAAVAGLTPDRARAIADQLAAIAAELRGAVG
jgi:hypothetical protein